MMWLQQIHDFMGYLFGFILNLLLIYINRRYQSSRFGELGRAILLSALVDLCYSIMGLLCRRVMIVKSGALIGIGYGIERYLGDWERLIFGCLYEFFVSQAVTSLPVLYYYRYAVTSRKPQPSWGFLLKYSAFSAVLSLGFAVLAGFSSLRAEQRGRQFYEKLLGPLWTDTRLAFFAGAHDTKDITTILYYSYSLILAPLSYGICIHYGYKLFCLIQSPLEGATISAANKALLRQFTKNLILQSVFSYLTTIAPSVAVMVCLWFRVDSDWIGPFCSSAFAYVPGLNALITLMVIRPYRKRVLRMFALSATVSHTITKTQVESSRPNSTKN